MLNALFADKFLIGIVLSVAACLLLSFQILDILIPWEMNPTPHFLPGGGDPVFRTVRLPMRANHHGNPASCEQGTKSDRALVAVNSVAVGYRKAVALPFSNQSLAAQDRETLAGLEHIAAASQALLLWKFLPEGFRTVMGVDLSRPDLGADWEDFPAWMAKAMDKEAVTWKNKK
jgi:hypothetical protein